MVTAIVLKALYALGGAVVGWFVKRWHVQGYIDEINRVLREEGPTPTDKPK